MQFTKLFNSILDSTIWQESKETKIVWVTMLAMCDKHGEIHAAIPGLARRAGVSLPECEDALKCLLSPDQYSRTKDNAGRRIAEIDGGWVLLNHSKYRELLSADERREYMRKKQQECRAKTSNNVKQCQTMLAPSTHPEAEAEAEAETSPGPGVLKSGPGVFGKLQESHLRNSEIMESWFLFATTQAKRPLFGASGQDSEANLLRVFAAAERALEEGESPLRLFKHIVGKSKWELITQAQEDRAAARIKALRRNSNVPS